jgi:hypothetical protein
MKICYLILAHNNPRHFQMLLDAIADSNSTVFVHVDAKSSIAEFRGEARSNVVFLDNRISIGWGGFSMITASLNLMRESLKCGEEHDYYCLLSGNDYPIKSVQYIRQYLQEHHGRQFMNLVEIPNDAVGKPISRVTKYCVSTESLQKYRVPRVIAHKISRLINKLDIQRGYQHALQGMKPYAGSQWWALTRPAVQHILEFVAANPRVVKFFRNIQIPDESFFHTIIGNSAFRENMQRSLSFCDWSRGDRSCPATIDEDHVEFFRKGNVVLDDSYGKGQLLFARKFPDDSARLIELVQKHVW